MPKFFPGENCNIKSIFLFIYVLAELRSGQLQRQQKYNEITNEQSQNTSKPGDKGG